MMISRVKTGIFGLDELLGGGFRKNSINVILGSVGVGKTIFALQYLLKGIEEGEKGVFVSFDMDEKAIVDLARSLGWDEVSDYVSDGTLLIGGNFHVEDIVYLNSDVLDFILNHASNSVRIVIDSFTPLIASLSYEMRKDVNWFFSKLREVGTTVVTLEEPLDGNLNNPSITVPIFLGDTVIHLKNIGYGEAFNRTLRIVKHRGSWHAEGVFPYRILRGLGIVVEGSSLITRIKSRVSLEDLLKEIGVKDLDEKLLKKLKRLTEEEVPLSRDEILNIIRRVIECS